MNKTATTLLLSFLFVAATPVLGQSRAEDAPVVESLAPDTTAVTAGDYAKALGIEGWDRMDEDSLIPITRDQAEQLLTLLIVEGRADSQRRLREAEILHKFKVEKLKDKLLDAALRKVYTEDYDRRLDRLETLLIAMLAQQNGGKLDPSLINYLTGGSGTPGLSTLTGATPAMPLTEAEPTTETGSKGTAAEERPARDADRATIPLAPGAKADSWEHFLSQVFFGFDSAKLSDEAKEVLDNVAGWIKENNMAVELRGYASPEGNMRYNNRLSGRRVTAAADYLKSLGIAGHLLRIVPSGEDTIKEKAAQYPDARRVDIRPYYGE